MTGSVIETVTGAVTGTVIEAVTGSVTGTIIEAGIEADRDGWNCDILC